MTFVPPIAMALSALASTRIDLRCSACGRYGQTSASQIRKWFGDITVAEALPKIAVARKCSKAIEEAEAEPGSWTPEGLRCAITCQFEPPSTVIKPPSLLGTAVDDGWQLLVRCNSHHAGLKSMRPCVGPPTRVDMRSLVIALGHTQSVDALERILRCPNCGRRGVDLDWRGPPAKPTALPPQSQPGR